MVATGGGIALVCSRGDGGGMALRLLPGGMHGCSARGMRGCKHRGHAWLLWGGGVACMGLRRDTADTVIIGSKGGMHT